LQTIWHDDPREGETQFEKWLYPFFLRLMEKYDVSYRLDDGAASLVAPHVPQVRPALPWLPEDSVADGRRRVSMVCMMDESPTGLVPWMIVRTHPYTYTRLASDGKVQRLHWTRGMFLRKEPHGEAMLELRGREFQIHTEALWPQYFMGELQRTVDDLVRANWPCGRLSLRRPVSRHSRRGRPPLSRSTPRRCSA
ncbi:MAG TPA: COR domain-containing protein, partial [Armatimonadota bacterium]|nr:COR domain-containing protein [Armatimonadota bacterium]